MRYIYILFISKLFLNYTWGRIKLIRIENLTQELQYYNDNFLPQKNSTSKFTRYKATLEISEKHGRIIGGRRVDIKEYPYMAYLLLLPHGSHWEFRGGAVIVGEYWAVTAAHCFVHISNDDIKEKKAFVCSNTSNQIKGCNRHLMVRKYVHEKYNPSEYDYDIALVRVKNSFNGKFEKPIRWANSNFKYPNNAQVTVLGWGYTNPSEVSDSEELRAVVIRLVNDNTCIKRHAKRSSTVTSRMVCAIEKGKDACFNDSGGPLLLNKILIGIVSWGLEKCADHFYPGVYTKVSVFNEWLRNKMGIKRRSMRRTNCNFSTSNVTNKYRKCAH